MRVTPLVLLAAIGASAHPSGHQHNHRAVHEKRDDTIVTATIDGKVVSWLMGDSPFKLAHKPTSSPLPSTSTTVSSTSVAPTSTSVSSTFSTSSIVASSTPSSSASPVASSTSAAASSTASSSGSGSGLSVYAAFPTCAAASEKRATSANIAYVGNTGCDGYGSNIVLIQSHLVSDYDYTVEAVSDMSSDAQCVVWNKIGPTGGIDGFFSGNEAVSFTLAAGSSQNIAFQANSQGGMCCYEGSVPTTSYGEFNCAWLEYDFGSSANDGWSGFDASALVEASTSGPYGVLNVCTEDNSVCSSLDGNGSGTNAYLAGDEAADGIGGNLAAGTVRLIATWS